MLFPTTKIISHLIYIIEIIIKNMGNQAFCGADTRDIKNAIVCGKEPEFRNSTAITIINHIPVVNGPPLNFQKQQTFKKVQKSAVQFCRENQLHPSYAPLVARIIAYGHNNLFQAYRKLPQSHKQQFLQEIKFIDIDFMDSLYHNLVLNEKQKPFGQIGPPLMLIEDDEIQSVKRKQCIHTGRSLFARRQVGVMLLCAGSSSRFLFQDKFLYPLQLKSHKTLLQILLERIRKNMGLKQNQVCDIPIIFACNSQNRYLIENFLKSKKYCGFDISKVRFIQISNHPILDLKGKLCLSFEYKVLNRPAGTAKCVQEMLGTSIYEFLKSQRVSYVHIVGTQNIVENPCDPFFIGYAASNKLELVGKCTDSIHQIENFHRYCSIGNKNYLQTVDEILNTKMPQHKLQNLIEDCPVAMNSIVCNIAQLKGMVKQYRNSMFLSKQYRAIEKTETFYNFEKERPELKQKVFIFEKDIGHLFTCSRNYHLIKVKRNEFVPIITRNDEYSMKEACKKLIAFHEKEMNFMRKNEEESTV